MNRWVYLVEARPVNDAGEEQIQRWSCGQTVGTAYGGVEWVNCLLGTSQDGGPFTYSAEIPLDTTVGGRSTIGYGALRLATQYLDNGALTALVLLHWDARPVKIWRVLVDDAGDLVAPPGVTVLPIFLPSVTPPMFEGTTDTPTFGVSETTVPLFDKGRTLDVPLQPNTYLGTGQLEGSEDIKGTRKPLGIGRVFHCEPVALDHEAPPATGPAYARVFQFSDGAVDVIQQATVYERAIRFDAVSTTSDVYTWTPVAGGVALDEARGVGRTGSAPVGVLTVVFTGNPDSLIPLNGFGIPICTHGNVLRAVLRLHDRVAADAIDEAALAALDVHEDNPCGIYVRDERTVAAVVDQLTQSLGAAWNFTAAGVFTVRVVGFRDAVDALTVDDLREDPRPVALPPPVWRFQYHYQPVERVLTDSDLGDAQVVPTVRAFVSEAVRTSVHETLTVQTVRPLARESEVAGRLLDLSPASAEGSRQARLLRQHRQGYIIRVRRPFGTYREGDTVTWTYPGFGLDAGKDFIIRRGEWFPSLLTDEDEVELTLWGPFVPGEDTRLSA